MARRGESPEQAAGPYTMLILHIHICSYFSYVSIFATSFDEMSASIFTILDFSDEILLTILRHLSTRERARLGNTCMKFYGLAFGEKQFFRNLDFSEDGYLVSSSDVRQYFKDVTMCQHMRTINLGNMCCSSPEPMIRDIKMAVNLVELNIIGITFHDLSDFESLLDPLENLNKLSAGWPEFPNTNPIAGATLKNSFKRLKHLTIRVDDFNLVSTFLPVLLHYSQQLEELFVLLVRIGVSSVDVICLNEILGDLEITRLGKLRIAAGYNMDYHYLHLEEFFKLILPDYERWTQFHMDWHGLLYYEKDVKVTQEMRSRIHIEDWHADNQYERLISYVVPGQLLADAAQSATGAEAKNFDCLLYESEHPVMLKIEDFKLLLENPRHQISYIHMEHDLEPSCLAYLSAFPDLRHLVIYGIIKAFLSPCNPAKMEGEFKDFKDLNEQTNPNPTFQKLVKNTPRLTDFALSPQFKDKADPWDLMALHLISGWKELTTLLLAKIPIKNGKFLVEIGKQCENLETLRLEDIGPPNYFCYKNELSEMMTYCRTLKDFSIVQDNIGKVSDMFRMFSKNSKLQRLKIKSFGRRNTFDKPLLRIETLIRSHKLILLWCEFDNLVNADSLMCSVQRLKDKLDRTAFEFQIIDEGHELERRIQCRNHSLEYAHKDLVLPHDLTNALYQLGC